MQKRAPAGFSVPHAAQLIVRDYSGACSRECDDGHISRQQSRVAIGTSDLGEQLVVDEREPPAVHLDHRSGLGRVPEGAQLARDVVARAHHAQLLELRARDVAALALGRARQLLAGEQALP